ncbi:MAG: hypothetical protein HC845_08535 [Akkermansiaceae bacterium]|nr:hypothetical protein [Akkermansiaceae bacterium]
MVTGLLVISFLSSCSRSEFREPDRHGPPTLVVHAEKAQLWLLVEQEEMKSRNVGGGQRFGKHVTEVIYHFHLHIYDAQSTERVSKIHLLTLKEDSGGRRAEGHILGQDGEVIWLFLNDQPIALSAKDGSRVADAKELEARNPALQGQLSKEEKFYLFDAGLVVITADGQRFRVRAPDFKTEPYTPVDDRHFSWMKMMATQWNGGYQTNDFLCHTAMIDGKWLGLLSEKDAADTRDDGQQDHFKCSYPEGKGARRTFWRARDGRAKKLPEGTYERIADTIKAPGAATYLESGVLIQKGGKEGVKEPFTLGNPPSIFILHRTRLDSEGLLAITRVDHTLKETWTAKLPIQELNNRFFFGESILMYGMVQKTEKGVTRNEELMTSLNLNTGAMKSWNVTSQKHE